MKKKTGFILALVAALGIGVGLFGAGYNYPFSLFHVLGTGNTANTNQFDIQIPSEGASAILVPGANNTNALGSSALRFSNVFTQLLNVAGTATVAVSSNTTSTTTPFVYFIPNLVVTVTTPTIIGQMGVTSAGKVYVATATATTGSWQVVGAQS